MTFVEEARAALDDAPYGVVLTDIRMPKMDGRALMAEVHARCPELPVVLMTGDATVDSAVAAMKSGAMPGTGSKRPEVPG